MSVVGTVILQRYAQIEWVKVRTKATRKAKAEEKAMMEKEKEDKAKDTKVSVSNVVKLVIRRRSVGR